MSLCSRGKGEFFRLGHGSDDHVRKPCLVEALGDKRVVDVAVGALHCLAVTEEGEVLSICPILDIGNCFCFSVIIVQWKKPGLLSANHKSNSDYLLY